MGRRGIAVRTQWQSGRHFRQRLAGGIKGEPPLRQRGVPAGEIQPDLSRKIYPACRRLIVYLTGGNCSMLDEMLQRQIIAQNRDFLKGDRQDDPYTACGNY